MDEPVGFQPVLILLTLSANPLLKSLLCLFGYLRPEIDLLPCQQRQGRGTQDAVCQKLEAVGAGFGIQDDMDTVFLLSAAQMKGMTWNWE
jgi:hypothetical protein